MGNVLSCKIYTVVSDAKRKHKLPRIYDGHTRSSNLSNIHEVSFSSLLVPLPRSTNLHTHFRIILIRRHPFARIIIIIIIMLEARFALVGQGEDRSWRLQRGLLEGPLGRTSDKWSVQGTDVFLFFVQLRLDQVIHGNGVEKRRGQSRMTFARQCECMRFVEDEGSILQVLLVRARIVLAFWKFSLPLYKCYARVLSVVSPLMKPLMFLEKLYDFFFHQTCCIYRVGGISMLCIYLCSFEIICREEKHSCIGGQDFFQFGFLACKKLKKNHVHRIEKSFVSNKILVVQFDVDQVILIGHFVSCYKELN